MFAKLAGTPLETGSLAPDFSLPDQSGQLRKLSDFRGKWLVLYFYPKDETPGCTVEACSFRDEFEDLRGLEAQVVGVSADDVASHQRFVEKHSLPFPLLADTRRECIKAYAALSPGGRTHRTTYIIDPQGRIADSLQWVNWFSYGATISKRLRALRSR
jgi:peroxiredoxin Q/BCP